MDFTTIKKENLIAAFLAGWRNYLGEVHQQAFKNINQTVLIPNTLKEKA